MFEHEVARPRVVVPPPERLQIHWTEFPLPNGIINASAETPFLLLLSNLQPNLDKARSALNDKLLYDGTKRKKSLVLFVSTESHDIFDACSIVPASIEDHDFSSRRKMLDVP